MHDSRRSKKTRGASPAANYDSDILAGLEGGGAYVGVVGFGGRGRHVGGCAGRRSGSTTFGGALAAQAADVGHVAAIGADAFAALAAGGAGLFAGEFVGR